MIIATFDYYFVDALASATATKEDADDYFKTGPSIQRKADAPAPSLMPATAVTLYASYCPLCLDNTYSVDVIRCTGARQ